MQPDHKKMTRKHYSALAKMLRAVG